MKSVTIETFKFDELSDEAKERAREWYREGAFDYDWWEWTYDDAARMGAILGIDILQKPVKLMNGKTRMDPAIWFSGFYHQGSGSAFDGRYSYAKGSVAKIKQEAPEDKDLHRIALALQKAQARVFYQASAVASNSRDTWLNVEVDFGDRMCDDVAADAIIDALRDFNSWIYRRLQEEYEYQSADEQVDESIRINEYDFTEDGARCAVL